MSPQLSRQIYGLSVNFIQNRRWGGFRPCVFIGHGLPLGLFMKDAVLCGYALWRTRSLRRLFGIPVLIPLLVLAITAILCKGSLSLVLMIAGVALFEIVIHLRSYWPLLLFAAIPLCFVLLRATGAWDAQEVVDWSRNIFGENRAASANTRVVNDTMLAQKARQRPLFGWGGWGRNRVQNERGRDISITDSFWVIRFGMNGSVGLAALLGVVLLPVYLLPRRLPALTLAHSSAGVCAAMAIVLACWMVDLTQNATLNSLLLLMAGGVAGTDFAASRSASLSMRRAAKPHTEPR